MTTIKTSYGLAKEYQQQIIKDSKQRGYNQELSEQYIQDRSLAASTTAKTGNMVFGGVVAAMAGKIALDAKKIYDKCSNFLNVKFINKTYTLAGGSGSFIKKELSFTPIVSRMKAVKMAANKQFTPFENEINKVMPKIDAAVKEKSLIKGSGKTILSALEASARVFVGIWKSIPRVVKIPAAILIGATTIKQIQDKATIDAKYDTLQYLENKKEQA